MEEGGYATRGERERDVTMETMSERWDVAGFKNGRRRPWPKEHGSLKNLESNELLPTPWFQSSESHVKLLTVKL